MTRTAKILMVAVLAVTLFGVAGLGAFRNLHAETPSPPAPASPADSTALLAPAGAGLDAIIAQLQARLTQAPDDWKSYAYLGLAYVQQARTTADPTYYPKAEGVLETSMRLQPRGNEEALVGLAALAAARHDFSGALRDGERARTLNPYDANVYGVIGDAQLELGRYPAAFATFQRMVDLKPNLSSYARVSYARELQGDVPGALEAMTYARDVAGTPADVAWASFQIGELSFNSGRPSRARDAYRRGLEADPSYVPNEAGLAKVAWASGDVRAAIAGYRRVVQRYPAPEHVIALGDLYASVGDTAQARQQYALVHAEETLFRANGVNVDLELALFDADHGDPAGALTAARAEWGRRHSIHVADAYAWALYANGRYRQAAALSRRAMALGTQNALFFFHAGMIELRLGHRAAARGLLARALATNPHFSILHAPEAVRTLAAIGGAA
jgi:tetratricopeptide (TPR) repeat protein